MSIFRDLWNMYEEEVQKIYPFSTKALLLSISPLGLLEPNTILKLDLETIEDSKKYTGFMSFKQFKKLNLEIGLIYEIEANFKSIDSFVIKTMNKCEM